MDHSHSLDLGQQRDLCPVGTQLPTQLGWARLLGQLGVARLDAWRQPPDLRVLGRGPLVPNKPGIGSRSAPGALCASRIERDPFTRAC